MKPFFDSRTVVLGLAVSLCCLLGAAVSAADETSGADAAPTPSDNATGDDALTRAAKEFGWGVEELDDGSVVLYPPSGPQTEDSAPAPAEAAPVTIRDAQQWRTMRLEDGSLILFQGSPDEAPETDAGAETLDEESANEAFAERGWGLLLEEDGTVEFYPINPEAANP